MSWFRNIELRFMLYVLSLTMICSGALVWKILNTQRQFESISWPCVQGEVLEIVTKSEWNAKKRTCYVYGRVKYCYAVKDIEYTSDLTDFGTGILRTDQQVAQEDMAHYHPGDKVMVYYDPKFPSIGVLTNGLSTSDFVFLILFSTGCIIGSGVTIYATRLWLQSSRTAQQTNNSSNSLSSTPEDQSLGHAEKFSLPGSLDELGKIQATFRTSRFKLCIGFLMGIGLILGSIYLFWHMHHRNEANKADLFAKYAITSVMSGLGIIGGTLFLAWTWRYSGHRILIGENGLGYIYHATEEFCPWKRIAEIVMDVTEGDVKVMKVPGAAVTCVEKELTVRCVDGKKFRSTTNSIHDFPRFVELLREAAKCHEVLWNEDSES